MDGDGIDASGYQPASLLTTESWCSVRYGAHAAGPVGDRRGPTSAMSKASGAFPRAVGTVEIMTEAPALPSLHMRRNAFDPTDELGRIRESVWRSLEVTW